MARAKPGKRERSVAAMASDSTTQPLLGLRPNADKPIGARFPTPTPSADGWDRMFGNP